MQRLMRVLLIDDDPLILDSIAEVLSFDHEQPATTST